MFKPREIGKCTQGNDVFNESPVAASVIGKSGNETENFKNSQVRKIFISGFTIGELLQVFWVFVATIQQDYFTFDKLWTGVFKFRSTSDSTQHSPQNPVLSLLFPSPLCNAVKKHFPSGTSRQSTLQYINTQ